MTKNNNAIKESFNRVRLDYDVLKQNLLNLQQENSQMREEIQEWMRLFQLQQREMAVEVKELKQKVSDLEAEKIENKAHY
ncbi:MAG: hypothetical protein ACOCUR_02910 [Nanoarchaeota archaeon]